MAKLAVPHPPCNILIHSLLECRKNKDAHHCMQVLFRMCEHGMEQDSVLCNHLVPTLVDCGNCRDALHIFRMLHHPNEHCWSSVISVHTEIGDIECAFHLYSIMQGSHLQPSKHTYYILMRACGRLREIERGRSLHHDIILLGQDKDLFIGNTVIDMYAKNALLVDAHHMFLLRHDRDVVSWNALIAGYNEFGISQEALSLFGKMQSENVSPSTATLLCLLKSCGSLEAVEACQTIHADIIKRGWEDESHVGSALIDVYAKCKFIREAQEIFNRMHMQDPASWAALISGYAECGLDMEVGFCFKQIQLKKVKLDAITFVRCLKACGTAEALEIGHEVHAAIREAGLELDLLIGNTLVDMYCRCDSLVEAQGVFGKLLIRDAVSWNTLIAGYVEYSHFEEALACFERMQLDGVPLASVTFICGLKACAGLGAADRGQLFYSEIVKKGLEEDVCIGSSVIDMYVRCCLLVDAQEVLDKLPARNAISWAALMAGYVEHGCSEKALDCFRQLCSQNVQLVAVLSTCCLKACGLAGAFEIGLEVHTEIIKTGQDKDVAVANTLVHMYVQCGSLQEGGYEFEKLSEQDVEAWTAVIHGNYRNDISHFSMQPDRGMFVALLNAAARMKNVEQGHKLFMNIVERGLERDSFVGNTLVDMYGKCGWLVDALHVFDNLTNQDVVSWNALLTGYIEQGLGNETLNCFEKMRLNDISPVEVTFTCTLKACGLVKDLGTGQTLHNEAVRLGLETALFVSNTLIDMYCNCDSFVDACEVFDKLSIRDDVTWNAYITGCEQHGRCLDIVGCFEQMLEGIPLSDTMFVCGLKACSTIGALQTGHEMHTEISKRGLERLDVCNALIGMYGQFGLVEEARSVFITMPNKDVASWSAMIKSYGENNDGKMAIQCFRNMQEHGVEPDVVTFTSLLAACCHSSLVREGQEYFNRITSYNVYATCEHYACMVDILARSGQVLEAERFAEAMQCCSLVEVSKVLLAACRRYGNIGAGLRFFHQFVSWNEDDNLCTFVSGS